MTTEEYNILEEKGFDISQINYIDLLSQFYPITLLNHLNTEINVNYMRNLYKYLKNNEVSKSNKEYGFHLLRKNLDPYLLFDDEYPDFVSNNIKFVIRAINDTNKDKIKTLISKIKYCKKFDNYSPHYYKWFDKCIESIIDNIDDVNFQETFKEEYELSHIIAHQYYHVNDLLQYIDISKLKIVNTNPDLLNKIIEISTDIDLTSVINSYDSQNIKLMYEGLTFGFDVNPYLLNKDYSNNVNICIKLLTLKNEGHIEENDIENILNFIHNHKITNSISKEQLFDLHNLIKKEYNFNSIDFEQFSTFEFTVYNAFKDDKDTIDEFIKIIKQNLYCTNPSFLDHDTINALYKIYKEKVDIKHLVSNNLSARQIKIIASAIDILKLDKNKFYSKKYNDYELDAFNTCLQYEDYISLKAFMHCEYSDAGAYELIIELMDYANLHKERFPVEKLLFDKGNDVFGDYNTIYEFSESQKYDLANFLICSEADVNDIEIVRDCSIKSEKMEILLNLLKKNIDISEIVKNIDKLSCNDIYTLSTCISLGYDIKLKEEKDTRS